MRVWVYSDEAGTRVNSDSFTNVHFSIGHQYPCLASEHLGPLVHTLRWDSIGTPLHVQYWSCWSGDPQRHGHIQVIKV